MSRSAGWHVIGGRARYWDGTQWVGGDFDPKTISPDMLADSRGPSAPSVAMPPQPTSPAPTMPRASAPTMPPASAAPPQPGRPPVGPSQGRPGPRPQAPPGKQSTTQVTPAGIIAFVVMALFMLAIFMDIG